MDYIEISAKTVDDAVTEACVKLGISSDKLDYEVVEAGSAGFLNLFSKPAVIKARKKSEAEENVSAKTETKSEVKAEVKTEAKPEVKAEVKAEAKPEVKVEVKAETKPEAKPAVEEKQAEKAEETTEVKESAKSKYTTEMPKEEIERRVKTFLNDMFKSMGMEVTITLNFDDPECVNVELSGENMGVLIGKRGQTLDSIQYLTSLVLNKGKDKYVRIKLDTEDYRNRRKETLESLAKNIAYKVKRSRKNVSLEPMNPYERRIIHSALQNDKFVSTKSEGEEPFRHVVVFLDREKPGNKNNYRRHDN